MEYGHDQGACVAHVPETESARRSCRNGWKRIQASHNVFCRGAVFSKGGRVQVFNGVFGGMEDGFLALPVYGDTSQVDCGNTRPQERPLIRRRDEDGAFQMFANRGAFHYRKTLFFGRAAGNLPKPRRSKAFQLTGALQGKSCEISGAYMVQRKHSDNSIPLRIGFRYVLCSCASPFASVGKSKQKTAMRRTVGKNACQFQKHADTGSIVRSALSGCPGRVQMRDDGQNLRNPALL